MPSKIYLPRILQQVLLLCAFVIVSQQGYSFFSHSSSIDVGAVLRASATFEKIMESSFYVENQSESTQSASLRATLDYALGNELSFQGHVILFYDNRVQQVSTEFLSFNNIVYISTERSSLFIQQHDHDPVVVSDIDRFNISYEGEGYTVIFGRQPINLATTFFFSVHDIFAPFSANTFYRIFKPGVDALRFNKDVGELGQFSLIYSLGYQADDQQKNNWNNKHDDDLDTLLGRYTFVKESAEFTFLLAKWREDGFIGAAMQGELYSWLGVRAEAQLLYQDQENDWTKRYVLGIEHRWENSFELRLEYFYSGLGSNQNLFSIEELFLNQQEHYFYYPGREYLALGQSYEISPLLFMQFVYLFNANNEAGLASLSFNYSMADNVEVDLLLSRSLNNKSDALLNSTEFHYFPNTVVLELRAYF